MSVNSKLKPVRWAASGAFLAALSVVLGAFATHTLRDLISPERLAVFQTGVAYMQYHALAVVVLAWMARSADEGPAFRNSLLWSVRLFVAGMVFFTGSLAVLAVTGVTWLGAVAPIGGVAFIAGWCMAAYGISRSRLLQTKG